MARRLRFVLDQAGIANGAEDEAESRPVEQLGQPAQITNRRRFVAVQREEQDVDLLAHKPCSPRVGRQSGFRDGPNRPE